MLNVWLESKTLRRCAHIEREFFNLIFDLRNIVSIQSLHTQKSVGFSVAALATHAVYCLHSKIETNTKRI